MYYSAIENNDIMKLAGKWMELVKNDPESGNLDPERPTWYAFTDKWILDVKKRITSLKPIFPEKLGNKENPRSPLITLEGEIDETSWIKWDQGSLQERIGVDNMREQDDQADERMEWESNKRDILIEGTIMGVERNLVLGKF